MGSSRLSERANSKLKPSEYSVNKVYRDVARLCKIATLDEIEAQEWSLNPGRYVGVAQRKEAEDFDESRAVGRVE
ncbi:N-6 DNA methylase [Microcoleus sp. F6_B4]|uniref:N-6 DNA methylase n=1 Tax=unclassified Microcoleus TaxID=2642155 RepID=UPI002FD73E35